jgi:hypothetical protein
MRGCAANGKRGRNAIAAMGARASGARFVHELPPSLLLQGGFSSGRGDFRRPPINDDHISGIAGTFVSPSVLAA